MSCKLLWIFATAVALSLPGGRLSAADESKTPAKTSPWKPEDVVYAETINDFSLSPDAHSVVWIRGEGDKEKDERVSNLFLTSLAGRPDRAIDARQQFCFVATMVTRWGVDCFSKLDIRGKGPSRTRQGRRSG